MSIPAISFSVGRDAATPLRAELDPGALAATKDRVSEEGASACVVRTRDLDNFLRQKDLVVDRGRKPERKELAALLLGYGHVPVIAGSYRSGGQLCRSVRTLLARAAARGERNLFIIGAADGVFDTLWELARPDVDVSASDAETLLALLPAGRVPEELEHKFIGTSLQARLVRRLVMRASAHDDPVLIVGDTGTGKEVVARAIHRVQPAACRDIRLGQLRGHPARPVRVGAVRPRAGVVHGCRAPQAGAVEGRRPRHALPRRDRRPEARPPGQDPSQPAGGHHPAGRRRQGSASQCAGPDRHEPRPVRHGPGRPVPRGLGPPAAVVLHPDARAREPSRGHPAARPVLLALDSRATPARR